MTRPRFSILAAAALAFAWNSGIAGAPLLAEAGAKAELRPSILPRVANREYIRSEFNRDQVLIGRQEIQIGALERAGDRRWLTARIKAYDKAGRLAQQSEVKVVCNLEDPVMLMGLVDLLRVSAGGQIDIEVDAGGSLLIIPAGVVDSLADLRLTIKSNGGWRGLIGGRKVLTVGNRRTERIVWAEASDSSSTLIRVREDVTVKSYGFGIRMRTEFYRGMADFDATGGLVRYKLDGSEGTSTIERRRDSAPGRSPDKPGGLESKGAPSR